MAVYLVKDKKGNQRLVETRTKAGAINYVSREEYSADALNTSELVKCIRDGLEVETPDELESEQVDYPEESKAPKLATKISA